jgi:hypothetical protein
VDSDGDTGLDTSLAIDSSDKVHISYYDYSAGALNYATNSGVTSGSGNCDNTDWNCSTVDDNGGADTSIGIDSLDNVHISYYYHENIRYATKSGVAPGMGNCTDTDWDCSTIDFAGYIYRYTSLAIDSSDTVHISYSDHEIFDLKYATAPASLLPTPNIKANDSDGPVTISQSNTLSVTIALNAAESTDNADWWVLADTPVGWYRYDVGGDTWVPGQAVTHQGPLFDLSSYEVLNMLGLPLGDYTFYFGVDTVMNGSINLGQLYYDSVDVTINP